MTKLEKLKKKIQEANPDKDWVYVAECNCPSREDYTVEEKIRLADVLLAMEMTEKMCSVYLKDSTGLGLLELKDWDDPNNKAYWLLSNDNLDNQSNECKSFLINLLLDNGGKE